jgi:hypothetical protein
MEKGFDGCSVVNQVIDDWGGGRFGTKKFFSILDP